MPGYYDIDEILAEEEFIPCQTMLDFSYLGHLNPDNMNNNDNDDDFIPEGTCIQMPLWSIKKWCDLNYVKIALPKQYRLKARERMESDPIHMIPTSSNGNSNSVVLLQRTNLKYMKYYETGRILIDLIMTSSQKVKEKIKASSSASSSNNRRTRGGINRLNDVRIRELDQLMLDAKQLQSTLFHLFKGIRMNHLFDWALTIGGSTASSSMIDDDTSSGNNGSTNDILLNQLTDMEKKLFDICSISSSNHIIWKTYHHYRFIPKQFYYHYPTAKAVVNNNNNNNQDENNNTVATSTNNNNNPPPNKRLRSQ